MESRIQILDRLSKLWGKKDGVENFTEFTITYNTDAITQLVYIAMAEYVEQRRKNDTILVNVLPIDVNKFIVWLFRKDEWHYDSTENLWKRDGYKSRTTDELYSYYLSKEQHLE